MNAKHLIDWICTESMYMSELSNICISSEDIATHEDSYNFFMDMFGGFPIGNVEEGYYVYIYTEYVEGHDYDFDIDGVTDNFHIPLEKDVICFFKIDDAF